MKNKTELELLTLRKALTERANSMMENTLRDKMKLSQEQITSRNRYARELRNQIAEVNRELERRKKGTTQNQKSLF
jgi:hypothetical protein